MPQRKMKSILILAVLFIAISSISAYKILFFLGCAFKSHRIAFDPVVEELAKRGNEVTVLSSIAATKEIEGVTDIPLVENGRLCENSNFSFFQNNDSDFFEKMIGVMKEMCHLTFQDPEVAKMLKNPLAFNYDVVVIDGIFNDFAYALGHHLGSSNILFFPGRRFGSVAWTMNIPHPISYLPTGPGASTDRMTFRQRVRSTFANVGFHYVRHNKMFPDYDEIIAKYIPKSATIAQLEKKVSFLIANTHPAIAPPMPSMPYYVEIGCVHCKPANPLPKELEDFMQSAGDDGVIYFSLGSVTKGNSMPLEMRAKVIEAFAQLPQKILWKYETDIENLPKNIKLIKWAPQQDILDHEKLLLFITHGGSLSISEAVYHRCPILGFPLSGDQDGNMATAAQRGFAEFLNWQTFTTKDFLGKINLILNEDRYQKAADHYSAIIRDHPQPPAETGAYWIEYVARHKGAAHLKSAAENLNFFQYFLLDVIGVILLVAVSVLVIVYLILRKVYHMLRTKKTTNLHKKKRN